MGGQNKTHIDYAYELDIAVKPDARVPIFNREFSSYSGAGIPLFSLGGGALRYSLYSILTGFHARRGYYVVETPILASSELFKLSGHLDFYRENMYLFDIEGHEFAVKPMNCPYHILVFLSQAARFRSKVRLPFKIFEIGRVHRYEPSGSVYGLLRVRGFTQDDAHIITPEGRVKDVVIGVFEEMRMLLEGLFRFSVKGESFKVRLSMADRSLIGKEFMGTPEEWDMAENALLEAAEDIHGRLGIDVVKLEGEAAFYGPKLDFIMVIEEAGVSKEWQMGTIQFDFNLPRRFRLQELSSQVLGVREPLYIVHRALLGSIERFIGVYLEHRRGRLPFSIAPLQFTVISVMTGEEVDRSIEELALAIHKGLIDRGFRSAYKRSTKTGLSGDVRLIETTVKPFVTVFIGPREVEESVLDVRVFDMDKMRRVRRAVEFSSPEDAIAGLEDVARELEAPVVKLAGAAPRIPGDYSHMV